MNIKLKQRSLFLRLLLGFMMVMLGIWICATAFVLYSVRDRSSNFVQQALKSVAQQYLVTMEALVERPDEMRRVSAQVERSQNSFFQDTNSLFKIANGKAAFCLQVWKDNTIIYASSPLPATVPLKNAATEKLSKDGDWVTVTATGRDSGVTVRVAKYEPIGPLMIEGAGFFFLPLLLCVPFLVLPAWFIIRIGLRPLENISADIEKRQTSDLSPLAATPYKELSPLVSSINRLMERLTERLELEREFLDDAAHELKTPLAVIQINADALTNTRNPQRIQETKDGLQEGVSRAAHVVHQLLALSRSNTDRDETGLQRVDLVELVRNCVARYAHIAIQRGIDIELQAPETCHMPLHRESIVSLINNLLDNAVKYSFDQCRVVVRVTIEAHRVQFIVADEGPGIPPELHKKVFERFFRLPGQDQPGSGLGLAIVERVAIRHNASICLSEGLDGKGLAVIVTF